MIQSQGRSPRSKSRAPCLLANQPGQAEGITCFQDGLFRPKIYVLGARFLWEDCCQGYKLVSRGQVTGGKKLKGPFPRTEMTMKTLQLYNES